MSTSTYLSEAEPFLEQYATRSPQNQVLVGAAGNLVRTENLLAIIEAGRDEEGDIHHDVEAPSSPTHAAKDTVLKDEGLIVFFPGISFTSGCANLLSVVKHFCNYFWRNLTIHMHFIGRLF